MSKHAADPARGLPEPLPEGEHILWQGAPNWRALALRAFHLRKLAIYFGVLIVWLAASRLADGGSLAEAVAGVGLALSLALGALAILASIAWLTSRTTLYTITNQRLVMRIGITLPMSINVPFRIVDSAGLKTFSDGTGDLPISITGDGRVAFLVLWPHARERRITRPEPMLRAIPDAAKVADILAGALAAAAGRRAPRPVVVQGRQSVADLASPPGVAAAL